MKNYILYENGYAKTFYRNIDEETAQNLINGLFDNQELIETEEDSLPTNQLPPLTTEDVLNNLRTLRETECFTIINRGQLWYNMLSEEQKSELEVWYKAWLDVTETKVIPEKPSWLEG